MPCRFVPIFSHLTHLTDRDQRNINQASHLAGIRLILQSISHRQDLRAEKTLSLTNSRRHQQP